MYYRPRKYYIRDGRYREDIEFYKNKLTDSIINLNDLLDSEDLVVKYYVSKSFYRTAPISVRCYLYFKEIKDIALFKLKYGL